MSQKYNTNIIEVLRITREMMLLADQGDHDRNDPSCGVLYGNLRDSAYKLRRLAEKERLLHSENGKWDINDSTSLQNMTADS
ncbi:MAG: hypothetical protein P9L92_13920 [Candidatus Electryonea clarkiae]|nr:hypothetical protein [Candidatus Electryonea clarkiae]MDP8285462.1 hypothetical protein [Candidatus Electryonea clarkiae]